MKKEQLNQKIEDVARAFGRPQTGIKALRALVTEITGVDLNPELNPEVTYKVGQRFMFKRPGLPDTEYILTQLTMSDVAAVNMRTGYTRGQAIPVANSIAITAAELQKIFCPADDAVPRLIW